MRYHLYFKISLIAYLLISDVLLPNQHFYQIHMVVLYCTLLLLEFFLLFRLRKKRSIKFTALTSLFVDATLISIIPFLWYLSIQSTEGTSVAFLLKTPMPLIAIGFITINAMTIRPQYPAIMSVVAFLVSVAHYTYVLHIDPTVFTSSLSEHFQGKKVHSIMYWVSSSSYFLFGIGLSFLTKNFRDTLQEAVNLEKANTQMGRYFSPQVAERIAKAENDFLKPGGKKQNVAVMFLDIRNFTKMSEELTPDEVTQFLSAYHTRVVDIIFQHGGTLDKFMGDGIMATFGTPEPKDDDLIRALRAGIAIKKSIVEFNLERKEQGKDPIGQGIGLHYGEAIVGNIGTQERLEYTVIGDTVNVASRIESACKETGQGFIISEIVKNQLGDIHAMKSLGPIAMKGKKKPMELFAIE